jgi:hypothetical protein
MIGKRFPDGEFPTEPGGYSKIRTDDRKGGEIDAWNGWHGYIERGVRRAV